ncbi:hypothetical protein NONI108955_13415 [Nocardia ninae]|uniref:Uncharacterized protein n=1 Tax=Nocardia ninae NBRC 108245 TaxID=1210091 RepID=A0A511MCB4_9NOCA|nr:hypothetical protein NN4_22470 [Nocardia ninae NBRC 108245]
MRKASTVGIMMFAAAAFSAGVAAADPERPTDPGFAHHLPTESFSFGTRNECVDARYRDDRASTSCTWVATSDGNGWSYSVNRNRINR